MATATGSPLVTTLEQARAARGAVNAPQLNSIEPGIRSLVDAINESGLVQTFTSCEGHYGYRPPPGDFTDRERANVGFFLRDGASEADLQHLFGQVLADYERHEVKEATFCIGKRYAAGLAGSDTPEVFYELQVRPRDRNATDAEKRRVTDRALAAITAAVWRATDLDAFEVVRAICAGRSERFSAPVLLAS